MRFLLDDIRLNKGQMSLFLLIFQSIGIRFFQGIGITLLLIIIFLNYKNIRFVVREKLIFFMLILVFICIIQDIDLKTIALYVIMIIASVVVIARYFEKEHSFILDFKGVANFFCLYGSITFLLLLILPQFFVSALDGKYLSFFGILYTKNSSLISSWHRMSSLAWEPGCFQLISSLYLLISIKEKGGPKKIIWLMMVQILTASSLGYINLIIVAIFFLIESRKSFSLIMTVVMTVLLLYPILQSNFTDKLEGAGSGSSTIRLRDFTVGIEKVRNNPIIGFPVAKLYEDSEAKAIEDRIWTQSSNYSKVDSIGYFSGGYTNGLMGLFLNWGVPMALWILFMFYKSPFLKSSSPSFTVAFFIIFLLTTVSEPITFSPLFFMFPISFFYRDLFLKKSKMIQQLKIKCN